MRFIGLDPGKKSVGWSVIEIDNEKGTGRLLAAGARTFPAAEIPKTGESPNSSRRLARLSRRRSRRARHRLERLRILFVKERLISQKYLSGGKPDLACFTKLHQSIARKKVTPYQLRFEGLERKLNPEEWIVVLSHCAKRRGFQSNSKRELSSADAVETGAMKKGIEVNTKLFEDCNYRTVGEMLWRDPKFTMHKRNKFGSYAHTLTRKQMKDEIKNLFQRQKEFGNSFVQTKFETAYLDIWASQRHYDQGNNIQKMIGKCTFESDALRAPSYSYTAERFMLWQTVNNLRYRDAKHQLFCLTRKQALLVEKLAYETEKVTYKALRKKLDFDDDICFVGLKYSLPSTEDKTKDPEAKTWIQLKAWHELRKLITKEVSTDAWAMLKTKPLLMDAIAEALGHYKADQSVREYLKKQAPQLEDEIIEAIFSLNWSKFKHLSLKALKRITPHLEEGLGYDKACQKAGYDFQNKDKTIERSRFLPAIPPEEIRNPIVLRSLSQARKVLNAIIREYGPPHCIHIELLRDIAHSKTEIQNIEKGQAEFMQNKERAFARFEELYHRQPRKDELLKFRLYEQQNNLCPYSGQTIEAKRLLEVGYVEIDHILPFSRSMDDGMHNKILCLTSENRKKGNSIPFEYLNGAHSTKWLDFSSRITYQMKSLPTPKKFRLMRQSFTKEEAEEYRFREVERTESKWIARFFKNHIEDKLEFAPSQIKRKIQTRNGSLTAFLRHYWGLNHLKKREENDRHHALDAIIVASATEGMVQRLSRFSAGHKKKGSRRQGVFVQPWDGFRSEVEKYIKESVFVSRPPRRKINGQAHKETIYSIKGLPDGHKYKYTPLKSLNSKMLEDLLANKEGLAVLDKTGQNKKLYQALFKQLEKHDGKAKQAFAEPFYHHEYLPHQKIPVRRIKSIEAGTGSIVRKGMVENTSMIRTDVFQKEKKYYLIPAYPYHRMEKELPKRVILSGKLEAKWLEIDSSFQFLFSLYIDDLIEIQKKHDIPPLIGYFKGTDRSAGSIDLEEADRSKLYHGIGPRRLFNFRKLQVDVLGKYSVVKREKRLELAKPHYKQTCRSKTQAK